MTPKQWISGIIQNLYTVLEGVFEKKTNKVTSLSSSSTDTQYPSAKCVYDAIPKITISTSNPSGGNDGDIWIKISS